LIGQDFRLLYITITSPYSSHRISKE